MKLTFIVAVLVLVGLGCSPATEANAKLAAVYEAEQLACVEKASTLAESRACRCDVMRRYHRACPATWTDGGAP